MLRFRLQTSADQRPICDTAVDERAGTIKFVLAQGSVIFMPDRGALIGVPIEEQSDFVIDVNPPDVVPGGLRYGG